MVTLSHADSDSLPVAPLIRPPLFVPEGQPAAILLRQLQRERRHLALVIDEHGGTAGIITLEDLLEEIVGEIADEYDPDAQEPLTVVAPDEIIVIGGLPIADLNDALDLELVEPGVDTVGGLITARLGRFARVGDLLELTDVRLEVLTVERTRIRRLRATRLTPRSGRDYDGA
jgi:magnesium and cobalt transporter